MKLKMMALTLVGLMAGVVFLTLLIYHLNEEKVCSQFQKHQLVHAQNVAEEAEEFFQDHFMTMQIILDSCRYEGMKRLKRDIELYSETMKAKYINGVSLYDESGKIIYSTGRGTGLYTVDELFARTKKSGNKEGVFVSPLAMDQIVVAVPVYQEMPKNKNFHRQHQKRFVGIFSISADLRKFLLKESESVKLQSHQTWIVKSEGTFLLHYQHPEMISQNMSKKDETCNRCHISNKFMGKIFTEKEGKVEYEDKKGQKKLAAFSSAQFGNASWTVVVDSEYDRVTGFIKKDFQAHLALIGLVFSVFLFGSFRLVRNDRSRIKSEQEAKGLHERIAERQKVADRLRFLSTQLLKSQETERRRIASELHDELGQDLMVFKLLLDQIVKKFPEDQKELKEIGMETIQCTDHLVENVHRIFHDLSPHVLENFGLTVALQRLIKDFAKLHDLRLTEDITNIDHLVPNEAHIIVYRILQEILNNIGKHAQACEISIAVKRNMDHITLMVKDDGKGFNMNRTDSRYVDGKGIGLVILEERVRMLDGLLDIQSEEGKGTLINVTIPILKDNFPN
jgi:signal transduction histidine kinase